MSREHRPPLYFDGQPDRFERMRRLVQRYPWRRPTVRFAPPKWKNFVLLTDAKGNSLMRRAWNRLVAA